MAALWSSYTDLQVVFFCVVAFYAYLFSVNVGEPIALCIILVMVHGHMQIRVGLEDWNDLSSEGFVTLSVVGSEAAAGASFKSCCCIASTHSQLGPC